MEVKVPKACEVACYKRLKKGEKEAFIRAVDDDYRVHWMVDNLPVGMFNTKNKKEASFSRGFPVGFHTGVGRNNAKHFLYNHIRIIIQYHDDYKEENLNGEESTTKIVGFRVEPMSIKHTWEGEAFKEGQTVLTTCNAMTPPSNDPNNFLSLDKAVDSIVFTYDVFWEKSDVEWSQRYEII